MTKNIEIGSVFFRDQYSPLVDGGGLPQCRPAAEREREVDQKLRSASYYGSGPLASTDAVLNFGRRIYCNRFHRRRSKRVLKIW